MVGGMTSRSGCMGHYGLFILNTNIPCRASVASYWKCLSQTSWQLSGMCREVLCNVADLKRRLPQDPLGLKKLFNILLKHKWWHYIFCVIWKIHLRRNHSKQFVLVKPQNQGVNFCNVWKNIFSFKVKQKYPVVCHLLTDVHGSPNDVTRKHAE